MATPNLKKKTGLSKFESYKAANSKEVQKFRIVLLRPRFS